ncbi:response regulator [Actinomadura graeca]|uniref:Transcriptional regulatory protein n=1 Tax=Actinomadura graeca TaxID=2750812 RepID=A0ABX8QUQ5_9ACTN|nr:response regulator [Actinomadura graeca]QXJ22555.1 response regulator [Actinomadura graeca]
MTEWRVLIVEDDPVVAGVHRRVVSAFPALTVVGIADSAESAAAELRRTKPHLVLLDLGLPGVDGLTLLRSARGRGIEVEVIAITAQSTASVVRAAAQLGILDYLVKPFAVDRLRQALASFLNRVAATGGDELCQRDIDEFRATTGATNWVPKDLTPERLDLVRGLLRTVTQGVTAEQAAQSLGVSRVTAWRYLEYLVTVEEAWVDHVGDRPGRPRKVYVARTLIG